MHGDPEFFFLKPTAWLDADKWEKQILGAFLKEFPSPTNGSIPNSRSKSLFETYDKFGTENGTFNDFVLDAHASSKKEASATLKSLAEVSFKGTTEDAHRLEGKHIRFRRLAEINSFFDEAKNDDDVKSNVPKWIKSGLKIPVCMVIGIMICEDVEVVWEEKRQKEMKAKGEIPVATIARAAAGIPSMDPTDGTGNPGMEITAQKSEGQAFRAKTGEKKIFALELRTITTGKMLKIIKRNELEMGDSGPSVDQGRKFGVDDKTPIDGIDDDELFLEIADSKAAVKEEAEEGE